MMKFRLLTIASLLLSAFTTQAGINEDSTKSGKLTVSGYVDVYYQYNLNNPSYNPNSNIYGGLPSVENVGRIFDIKNNQFSIGLAQTKFAYTTDKSEVVVDLTYGPNAALGNFGNVFGTDINIKQAYMSYMFTSKLNVTVGQFGTHVGYELIDAPLNYNYSLSYLFGNGPFYHTGAKASYEFSEKFGVMFGIVNGWDSQYDFNGDKSPIAQIFISPKEDFNIYINYVGGNEKNGLSFPTLGAPGAPISTTAKTITHLFDLTTSYQLTDNFKLGLNAAYGFGNNLVADPTQTDGFSKGSWGGAALYADYKFSEFFGLGLRAEHFIDNDAVRYIGATLGATAISEFTVTGNMKFMDGHFNLKPEFRIDVADVKDDLGGTYKGFTKNPGGDAKATNVQPTIGMAAIYAF
jgi:hypothetical protein